MNIKRVGVHQEVLSAMNESVADNWENWEQYRASVKVVLERSIDLYKPGTDHLLILGAGNGNDMPIEYVESTFSKITIVDCDEAALNRFIEKSTQKDKFNKVLLDLSGIGELVKTKTELLNKMDTLHPDIDFSGINTPYDTVINSCFAGQLLSCYFYEGLPTTQIPLIHMQGLQALTDRILNDLFDKLSRGLRPNGLIIHLADTLEASYNKISEKSSPGISRINQVVDGDFEKNIGKFLTELPHFANEGLCLMGSILPAEILETYKKNKHYSLLWQFANNEIEFRLYIVIVTVLSKR